MADKDLSSSIIEKVWDKLLGVALTAVAVSAASFLTPVAAAAAIGGLLLFAIISVTISKSYKSSREEMKNIFARQDFLVDSEESSTKNVNEASLNKYLRTLSNHKHLKRGLFLRVKALFSFEAYEQKFWGDLEGPEKNNAEVVLSAMMVALNSGDKKFSTETYEFSKVERLADKVRILYNGTQGDERNNVHKAIVKCSDALNSTNSTDLSKQLFTHSQDLKERSLASASASPSPSARAGDRPAPQRWLSGLWS